MKISELSIKRPVTTLMMTMIIIILGVISFTRLNVDLLPDINLPIAAVTTSYSGAGPNEVENILTRNIEGVLATVGNLKSMRSISSEGNSTIILEFNQGTDMDFATLEIREKLDFIRGMLPDGISDPMVLKLDPTMMPIMNLGVSQEGKEVSELVMWMEDVLKPRLERVEGVASVSISGGEQREVKVIVDPVELAQKGIGTSQIANALRMENINLPGGIASDGQFDLLVRTTGEFNSLEDIKNVSIMTQTGSAFQLRDIATIEEGTRDNPSYAKINGEDSLSISIQKESTANTVRVSERVNEELENIKNSYDQVQIVTIFDQAQFITQSISTVSRNLLIGGILAIIILLIFLKNGSPTIVIATAIPISVVATFIFLYFSNINLNIISLGGLALGVGMLVDNSIVVLENIYRMRQKGIDRISAAYKGSSQVSMAIIASTLTTICVFLPIVFVEGITAEIFKELALTVTFSLVASLGVALTLVPMLASKLLRNENFQKKNKILDRIDNRYRKILKWALLHRLIVVIITIIVFTGSLIIIPYIGTEYFPIADEGQIDINIRMPRGTRFDETLDALIQVEDIVSQIPEVATVSSQIGGQQINMINTGTNRDRANITLILKPLDQRDRSTEEVGDEIREVTGKIPGAQIRVNAGGSMMGGGVSGGSPVSIEIMGDDLSVLNDIADNVVNRISKIEGIREARSSFEEGVPELRIKPDRARASQYGISTAVISQEIQSILQGTNAGRFASDRGEIDIRIQLPHEGEQNIGTIERLYINSPMGVRVPLNSVATIEYERGPTQIDRKDQSRMVTVSASLYGRSLGEAMGDIQEDLKNYNLPDGYTINYAGENEQLEEAFSNLTLALILGIVLVYMVMASQFESLIYPFIIMFTVPLAFTGALGGLLVTRNSLSVPSFLGMVMLAGIVVNNGIVMVDYINTLRRDGVSRDSAMLEAGPTRLRPILMTTMTTILALVPLSMGIGEGSEIQAPLAITVIGGLALSTVLTLIIVPVIYSLFDDLSQWINRNLKVFKPVREGE